MKLIETILEIIGWLQITLGVTLAAGLVTLLIYLTWDNESGKAVSIILLCVGFITGAIWATFIWKKHGTLFLAECPKPKKFAGRCLTS
jgi:hypothetical protein